MESCRSSTHGVVAWVIVHNPCLPACCMDKQSLLRGPKRALACLPSLTTLYITDSSYRAMAWRDGWGSATEP